MRKPDAEIDIKHLMAFNEILKRSSISDAAIELGVSQPSVSLMLAKLREHFGDPLFVRTPNGMQPTPRAKALSPLISDALAAFRHVTIDTDDFDPLVSKMTFRISLTDIGQVVMLPMIANRLRELAPTVHLDVSTTSEDSYKRLESDELDLAFGSVRKLQPSFFQKNLFKEQFVCILSKAHPRIGQVITIDQYMEERHVTVNSAGTGGWIVEAAIDRHLNPRNIVFELPTFLGLAPIVEGTDLIATVPLRLAEVLTASHRIKVVALPIKIPPYDVKQYWHERQHNNPANKWLRGVVSSIVALKLARQLKN